MTLLILDSGGLRRLSQRTRRAAALIAALRDENLWPPVVPTVVIAESTSGTARTDNNVNRFLKSCDVDPIVPETTARRAGYLRARAGTGSAVVLGLRFEEVAGLRVKSFDPDARAISVTETVTTAAGRLYIGPPKTAAGHRTLAAPELLVHMLRRHVEAEALSEAEDLLFPDSRGGPLRYSNFRRRVWDPACERAELPKVGFHDLRRTAITAMVAAGVDVKTAQTRAGHSDPRMTLAVYAKATETADRAAADAVGKLFLTADD